MGPITWKREDLSKGSSDWPEALSYFVPPCTVSWSGQGKALRCREIPVLHRASVEVS